MRRYRYPLWLLTGFWVCVVIAIGAVVRRLIALTRAPSGGSSPLAVLDAAFDSHAALTLVHIVPAALFVIVAACVLLRRRAENDWLETTFFVLGAVTGLTAYAMSRYAVGGWVERSAVLVFNTWFLLSLSRAYWFRFHGDGAPKREWMTRAVAVLLGIATTRPVMGVFFATSPRTHLSPHDFFGIAFWIGFSINAVAVEFWLRSKTRARLYDPEGSFQSGRRVGAVV